MGGRRSSSRSRWRRSLRCPIALRAALGEPSGDAAPASVAEGLAPLLAWWPAVVDLVRTDNALLGACIEEARPVEVTGEDLTVAFSATAPFLKKKAENPDNRAAVTAALQDITGRRWRLSYELHDEMADEDGAQPAPGSEEEWLKRFMDEFDAEEVPGEWAAAPVAAADGDAQRDSPAPTRPMARRL